MIILEQTHRRNGDCLQSKALTNYPTFQWSAIRMLEGIVTFGLKFEDAGNLRCCLRST